jgi:hypothetical protein
VENFYYEPMEMPTPCEHCGTIFDLNDGYRSDKWHDGIVICAKCHEEEEREIEEDERWETINLEISNALYGLDKEDGAWAKLEHENRALIIQLVSNSFFVWWQNTGSAIRPNKDEDYEIHVKRVCDEFLKASAK